MHAAVVGLSLTTLLTIGLDVGITILECSVQIVSTCVIQGVITMDGQQRTSACAIPIISTHILGISPS